MPYWRMFYHLVWGTKGGESLLTPVVEPIIHNYLRAKALELEARVFALNGIEDHIHMVVSIPPKISVAKFIGQVKGATSTKFNKLDGVEQPFFWQREYGVFTFDEKRLPNYITYVERQKKHHAQNTVVPILERLTGDGVVLVGGRTPGTRGDKSPR